MAKAITYLLATSRGCYGDHGCHGYMVSVSTIATNIKYCG